jgi:hypothetical protein
MTYISIIVLFLISLFGIKKFKCKSWVLIPLLFLSLFIALILEFQNAKEKKYSVHYGEIESNKITKPVYLGSGNFKCEILNGVLNLSTYDTTYFKKTKFRAWIEDKKLLIDADLKNDEGRLIARIERNEWTIKSNEVFDKNFDDNAIEILDSYGDIVFQVDLVDRNHILLRGIFYGNDSTFVLLNELNGAPFISVFSIKDKEEILKKLPFKSLFKFPSNLHMGERL